MPGLWRRPPQPQNRRPRVVRPSAATNYANVILSDSPVAFYRLNEPSGSVMTDDLGSHTGAYVGTPTLNQSGMDGTDKSILLDGTGSGYGQVTAWTTMPPKGTCIEAWIKYDGVTPGTNLDSVIAGWGNGTGDSYEIAVGQSGVAGTIELGIYTDTGNSHYNWVPAG